MKSMKPQIAMALAVTAAAILLALAKYVRIDNPLSPAIEAHIDALTSLEGEAGLREATNGAVTKALKLSSKTVLLQMPLRSTTPGRDNDRVVGPVIAKAVLKHAFNDFCTTENLSFMAGGYEIILAIMYADGGIVEMQKYNGDTCSGKWHGN